MALGTYAQLQTTVADWLNRGDLTLQVPDFITLVESRLRRLLKTKNTVVQTIQADAQSEALPSGIKELRSVSVVGRGALTPVSYQEFANLKEANPNPGLPKFYTRVGDTLYFVPAPAGAPADPLDVELVFEAEILPLATNSTNWLLTWHPDVYLYGALVEASPFLRDDPRVPMFESRFKEALNELEVLRDRQEFPNTPVARPRRVF